MIGKVFIGKNFGGCVRYVVQKPEAKVLEADGIRTYAVTAMIADFNLLRKLNPDIERAVGHIALSWSVHDRARLSDRLMVERAKEYMAKMQITSTQYLIVRHLDRQHPHLHIIYNRVSYEGKTISDKFQHPRNAKVCQELNLKYGYYMPQDKMQINRQHLTGIDKAKYELHDLIQQALPTVRTWKELEHLLQGKGIAIRYKYDRETDQIQGISFRLRQISFKGSSIDNSLSYGAITRQLEQNSKQALLISPASRQQQGLVQSRASSPDFHTGRNSVFHTAHHSFESLLAPTTRQAADATNLDDYHLRKKKRKKKKGMRL